MNVPFSELFQRSLQKDFEYLAHRRFTASFRERLEDRYIRALDYLHERRCREAKRSGQKGMPAFPCARCGDRIIARHLCWRCEALECHSRASRADFIPRPPELDEEPELDVDAEPRTCVGCSRTVDGFADFCHFCAGDATPWTVDGWLEAARKATNPEHFYLEDNRWTHDARSVATHEAGHAVVAAVLGLGVKGLSLTKCGCGCECWEGITNLQEPAGWDGRRETAIQHKPYFARMLIVKAAGHAAEQKLQGKKLDLNETGSGTDYQSSVDIAHAVQVNPDVLHASFAAAKLILDMPEAWELVEKVAAAVQVAEETKLGADRMPVLLDGNDARLAACRSRLNGLLPPVVGGPS